MIGKWPAEIDISEIRFFDNGGANIKMLNEYHDSVEEECMSLGDEVLAMDWSMFQYLHKEAKMLHRQGVFVLKTKNIDIGSLKELYDQNTAHMRT